MGNNNDLDEELLKRMFNSIRTSEVKNIKIQKEDDKGMVRIIEDYVGKKVKEEMKANEN